MNQQRKPTHSHVERAKLFSLFSIVWPEHYGAVSLAKRAAAGHILLHPDKKSSSQVAHAVRATIGASLKSLGLPSFKQLLLQDPCFCVSDVTASEAVIDLDKRQLQAAADSRLHQAVELVLLPDTSDLEPAVRQVIQAVALLLLKQPCYRARCSWVAAAVDQSLGSMAKLGISTPFRQLLDSHTCLKLTPAPVKGDMYVKLDVKQLLQQAERTTTAHVSTTTEVASFSPPTTTAAAAVVTASPPPPPLPPPPLPPPTATAAASANSCASRDLIDVWQPPPEQPSSPHASRSWCAVLLSSSQSPTTSSTSHREMHPYTPMMASASTLKQQQAGVHIAMDTGSAADAAPCKAAAITALTTVARPRGSQFKFVPAGGFEFTDDDATAQLGDTPSHPTQVAAAIPASEGNDARLDSQESTPVTTSEHLTDKFTAAVQALQAAAMAVMPPNTRGAGGNSHSDACINPTCVSKAWG